MAKAKSTKKGSDKVVVALNNPSPVEFELSSGKVVTLAGNAENLRGKPQGQIPVGAFGLTTVDADEWEEIVKKYGKLRMFKNGLCFASNSKADAMDEAEEKAELRHGREPVSTETAQTVKATE